MSIDLTKLSLDELQGLLPKVEAELTNRKSAERAKAQKEILELAGKYGMSVQFTGASAPRAKAPRASKGSTVAPKYQHPKDASLTWTGRGKPPRWVVEWKNANGGSMQGATL